MPAVIAALWGALIQIVGTLVGRAVVSLGVGVVAYKGLGTLLDKLQADTVTSLVALGPEVSGMLVTLKVGTFISIIFSALLARLVLNGLTSDTLKKWVTK